jgi:DNA-binding NarL/FixJ family response regulator
MTIAEPVNNEMNASRPESLAKARILAVDDHQIFRESLVQWLNRQSGLICCGAARRPEDVRPAIREGNPDLILLDLRLSTKEELEPFALIKSLESEFPDLPILVLSQYDETQYAEGALRAGARGYVMKQEATDVLPRAIRTILNGHLYVSRRMIRAGLQD